MDPMALSAMVGEEPTVRRANATESPAVGSGLKASRWSCLGQMDEARFLFDAV